MAYSNLKNGSSGSDVKKLQQELINAGYNVGKTGADGIYGANTAAGGKKTINEKVNIDGGTAGDKATGGAKEEDRVKENLPALPESTGSGGTSGFNYGQYAPSDIVQQALALLNQHNASKPGAYESQWAAQIQEYLDKIMNREKFSYNFNEDALYQMYKDQYIQQGQMAMMDTMGQAAAMTGGYGNSYAQTVGQQAYNQQLTELNNIIPELYQMAFDQYAYEGDQLYNQYGLLMDQENMDYGRYMDNYNMWADERDYLTGRYDTERNFDYNVWSDGYDRSWQEYVYGNNMSYQQGRDQVTDQNNSYNQLAGLISSTGYKPTADELNAAGMSQAQANALMNSYKNSQSGSGTDNKTGTDYKDLDVGSTAYSTIKKEIDRATSPEELNDITLEYLALGYNPDQIKALIQKKLKEFEDDDVIDTTVPSLGSGVGGGGGGRMLIEAW